MVSSILCESLPVLTGVRSEPPTETAATGFSVEPHANDSVSFAISYPVTNYIFAFSVLFVSDGWPETVRADQDGLIQR